MRVILLYIRSILCDQFNFILGLNFISDILIHYQTQRQRKKELKPSDEFDPLQIQPFFILSLNNGYWPRNEL